ncbi:MAG: amino acid racemase [Candidatus Shapirobacteria bacterium]|jgi:aspartate racemase
MIYSSKKPTYFGATNNNDYPEIIIDSIPVPDFISDTFKLEEARKMLVSRTRKLINFGTNVQAIACNTAHLLYPELSSIPNANFISMIDVVAQRAIKLGVKRIGLLATPTTIKMRLYQDKLNPFGIDTFVLSTNGQKMYEIIIRSVLAGKSDQQQIDCLYKTANDLSNRFKLEAIILGCTELPLVFPKAKFKIPILDSLDILADSLLANYKC